MHWFWRLSLTIVIGNIFCFVYFCVPLHQGIAGILSDVVIDLFGPNLGDVLSIPLVFVTPPMLVVLGIWSALSGVKTTRILDQETRCRKCGYILKGIPEPRCPECGERI